MKQIIIVPMMYTAYPISNDIWDSDILGIKTKRVHYANFDDFIETI